MTPLLGLTVIPATVLGIYQLIFDHNYHKSVHPQISQFSQTQKTVSCYESEHFEHNKNKVNWISLFLIFA